MYNQYSNLQHIKTLEWFDGPLLVSLIDDRGQLYLDSFANVIDNIEYTILFPILKEDYNNLLCNKISYYDVWHKSNFFDLYKWDKNPPTFVETLSISEAKIKKYGPRKVSGPIDNGFME